MSNLLILYEIAQKASTVTNRKALAAYEKWIFETIHKYRDAGIEHMARVHLMRLKEQFA